MARPGAYPDDAITARQPLSLVCPIGCLQQRMNLQVLFVRSREGVGGGLLVACRVQPGGVGDVVYSLSLLVFLSFLCFFLLQFQ